MEYPYLIQIETIVACNSQCKMCGMRVMTRPAGKMSWELFKKVIDDCKELPINFICPFIQGEPLCDNRMIDMLWYIKEEMPKSIVVGWFTNGLRLTEEIITEIAKMDIIEGNHFNFSLHGGNKEIYEANTGVKWEKAMSKLDLLIDVNQHLSKPFQIRIQMCDFSLTHESIEDFKILCQAKNVIPCVCGFSNNGGLISDIIGDAPTKDLLYKLCHRSQYHVYVLWDGRMNTCCFDVNGINIVGDVNKQSIKGIWESEQYQEFRQLHRDGRYKEIPVCRDCNSNRFNG